MTTNVPAVVEEHRQEIAEAQASGDLTRANQAYAAEQAALAGLPAPSAPAVSTPAVAAPESVSEAQVQEFVGAMREYDADGIAELERLWPGTEMANNLNFVRWWMVAHMTPEEIAAAPDDPVLVRAVASMARREFHQAARAPAATQPDATTTEGEGMTEVTETEFEDDLEALREKIQVAQAKGDTRRANRLYQAEQAMIGKRQGNQPIVGSGQRYA